MIRRFCWGLLGIGLLLAPLTLSAQQRTSALINGNFSSSFDLLQEQPVPAGDATFSYGWTNFVNLRFKSQLQDSLSFYLAFNLNALAGYYAELAGSNLMPDLERLYFKVGFDRLDVEAGLIRVPRGYGFVFSPLDIFNLRDATNSLDPQARPRGRWGIHTTFYPQDMWRLEFFALAPDDPFEKEGWGSKFGLATNFSLGRINWDLLYALYLPEVPYGSEPDPLYLNNNFVQVAGFALKADIEIGLFVEALYRFDHRALHSDLYYGENFEWYNGLEAALGVDYTLPAIDVYLLAEYLFYGSGYTDWDEPGLNVFGPDKRPLPYARHDYLYMLTRYTPRQDFRLGLSCLLGLDDLSALFTVFGEYDLVHGLTLQASYLLPVDKKIFDTAAEAGEWGSSRLGFQKLLRLGVKAKI